jgi:hypothetical protein
VLIFLVDGARSRWHGTAESRGWAGIDGLAQGGGTVSRHGGVDSWSSEGLHFDLSSGVELVEDGGGDFWRLRRR